MPSSPGQIQQLWYRWKALRFPWRKRWLCGFDLAGNTFWEFKDQLNANRYRRIVKYSRNTHYGDVKVPPQWMQWLRHARQEAPTLAEQEYDVARQRQMKLLAAAADERWASKPSALDAPEKQQPITPFDVNSSKGYTSLTEPEGNEYFRVMVEDVPENVAGKRVEQGKPKKQKKETPWKVQQGNPGDDWQPSAWTPNSAQRRT